MTMSVGVLQEVKQEATAAASNGHGPSSSVTFDPKVKLNDRNELAALALAEDKCREILSQYPTTLLVNSNL